MNDLDIIKKLETSLGFAFTEGKVYDSDHYIPIAMYQCNAQKQVIKLRISQYQLKNIPLEINGLVNLQSLDLERNQIKTLTLSVIKQVNNIHIKDNPLTSPAAESQALALVQQYSEKGDTPETFTQKLADAIDFKSEINVVFGKFEINWQKIFKAIGGVFGNNKK
ncbi:MAG: hypothetical protein ACKVTZ_18940 [Bacteroidia bacterium]